MSCTTESSKNSSNDCAWTGRAQAIAASTITTRIPHLSTDRPFIAYLPETSQHELQPQHPGPEPGTVGQRTARRVLNRFPHRVEHHAAKPVEVPVGAEREHAVAVLQ